MNASTLRLCLLSAITLFICTISWALPPEPTEKPLFTSVDLNVGEEVDVTLGNGEKVHVKLLDLQEKRDPLRDAVREARVKVEMNGDAATLTSANYNLPVKLGGMQIDCPITKGYNSNSTEDSWGLKKDARLRVWPGESVWGLFGYPVKQRWFASGTQMANEPCFVDGGDLPTNKKIYYHDALDFGGCEGMVDVVAATDGLVVSSAKETLPGYESAPVKPRGDVVYVLDARGWYFRYSHLCKIDPAMKPGAKVKLGQRIGVLGKEGASGGWAHLHFGIKARQPSGAWGTEEAYAFVWEAYLSEHKPPLMMAIARPHQLVYAGEKVTLDGSKSRWINGKSAEMDARFLVAWLDMVLGHGRIKPSHYDWTFTDGSTATGPTVERMYAKPGMYSEILKVSDGKGAVAYDFAVVQVIDKGRIEKDQLPPSIQAAYAPSLGVKAGDKVTFKVRSFRTTEGQETWDFGDGTAPVNVKSDGCVKALAKDGFAITEHSFAKPGNYIVKVERANSRGEKAMAHLWVEVGER